MNAINSTSYFTPQEKSLFFGAYRKLLTQLSSCLHPDDLTRMRALMDRVVPLDCYERDENGINGLLRNIDTALIATQDLGLKRTSVLALLLHRPVLKGMITLEEVEASFNQDVSLMIRRLLKTTDLYARNVVINSENFHHLLFSFAEDLRVIMIMIADRLSLLRLGKQIKSEKTRVRLSNEVLNLYAPLAHRLGLYAVKSEMEDLALKYIEPEQYRYIKAKLNETKKSRDLYIEEFIDPLEEKLQAAGLPFDIKGRTKSIFSINNKLKKSGVEFEGIYDLFAIRIILDTPSDRERSDIWQAFSIVTDLYQPNPKRLRDWVSVPKSNGYESLHITVLGPQRRWVEVQIRTRRMDEVAERGLAAHWKYKGVKEEHELDKFMSDVRAMLESPTSNPAEMMKEFKMDLYKDEIYVFTPTGDLIQLGKGATVLDFAFAIHTSIGSRCVSGKVNGKNVSIRYQLNNGDSVEIVTSSTQSPKPDWLLFVTTTKARQKIKQVLREESAKRAEYAKELLQRRFKNRKIEIDESTLMRQIKKRGYKTITAFYVDLADERLDINTVIEEYLEMERRDSEFAEMVTTRSAEEFTTVTEAEEIAQNQDVLVIDKNLTGIDYRLAKCCNPIYGDEIFGFISTQGIKIHRADCPNAHDLRSRFAYRLIPARWSGKGKTGYGVMLRIIGNDDISIVSNITSVMTKEQGVSLRSLNINSDDGLFQGTFTIVVNDTVVLTGLIKKIKTVKGVKTVSRMN